MWIKISYSDLGKMDNSKNCIDHFLFKKHFTWPFSNRDLLCIACSWFDVYSINLFYLAKIKSKLLIIHNVNSVNQLFFVFFMFPNFDNFLLNFSFLMKIVWLNCLNYEFEGKKGNKKIIVFVLKLIRRMINDEWEGRNIN